ncbi:MAG: GAF domain-containing protein [Candidatus Aminicenantes bacterium]|nr:GAF domain-containing protein [Candidatus Aminicenantes bacterium]
MHKAFLTLRYKFSKKIPEIHPWQFFKELENSLNIIEDLDQIALNFLGKIREIIPVTKQILFIYDQDLEKFRVNNFLGFDQSEVKNILFLRNESLVKWLKVNESYLYVKKYPWVLNNYLIKKEKEILKSLGIELCFPLISMNRLIGIIFIGPKKDNRAFLERELSFISFLTPQIGMALENAILFKEQREIFRRMSRANKLAAVGELAAGAAHEMRNPLTAIKSSIQYLTTKRQNTQEKNLLLSALKETERIEEILSALLSFSRHSDIKMSKCNLLETLENCLELISFQAKKQKVKLSRNLPFSSLFIKADNTKLKQLFLNLFLNSLQAMKDGGELKVEVTLLENQRVLIIISDTGEGISKENLDKIFDPFFTTKKGGTGLGLSICYGIVKSHQGEMEVKSKLNYGTTALVKLPFGY